MEAKQRKMRHVGKEKTNKDVDDQKYRIVGDDDKQRSRRKLFYRVRSKEYYKIIMFICIIIFLFIIYLLFYSTSLNDTGNFKSLRLRNNYKPLNQTKTKKNDDDDEEKNIFGKYADTSSSLCEVLYFSLVKNPQDLLKKCNVYYPGDLSDKISHDEAGITMQSSLNQTLVTKNSNSDLNFSAALLTRKGYKDMVMEPEFAKHNQDRSFLMFQKEFLQQRFMMGLFDGHGSLGHVISDFAAKQFPIIFSSILKKREGNNNNDQNGETVIRRAFQESFFELDKSLPSSAAEFSGSTAIVAFFQKPKLYVANAGDSKIFVAKYSNEGGVEILFENEIHKPSMPVERQRIESLGGEVLIPSNPSETSRVIISKGEGGLGLGLAMSRSIGDWDGEKVGVISDPSIDVINVSQVKQHLFVVIASDGLFDYVLPNYILQSVAHGLYSDNNVSIDRTCEKLIMEASGAWKRLFGNYRDDITISVTKIK